MLSTLFWFEFIALIVAGAKGIKQVHVNPSVRMQSIIGFGGAFTDAAGINIDALNTATQEQLMQSYYGPNGAINFPILIIFIYNETFTVSLAFLRLLYGR